MPAQVNLKFATKTHRSASQGEKFPNSQKTEMERLLIIFYQVYFG